MVHSRAVSIRKYSPRCLTSLPVNSFLMISIGLPHARRAARAPPASTRRRRARSAPHPSPGRASAGRGTSRRASPRPAPRSPGGTGTTGRSRPGRGRRWSARPSRSARSTRTAPGPATEPTAGSGRRPSRRGTRPPRRRPCTPSPRSGRTAPASRRNQHAPGSSTASGIGSGITEQDLHRCQMWPAAGPDPRGQRSGPARRRGQLLRRTSISGSMERCEYRAGRGPPHAARLVRLAGAHQALRRRAARPVQNAATGCWWSARLTSSRGTWPRTWRTRAGTQACLS